MNNRLTDYLIIWVVKYIYTRNIKYKINTNKTLIPIQNTWYLHEFENYFRIIGFVF